MIHLCVVSMWARLRNRFLVLALRVHIVGYAVFQYSNPGLLLRFRPFAGKLQARLYNDPFQLSLSTSKQVLRKIQSNCNCWPYRVLFQRSFTAIQASNFLHTSWLRFETLTRFAIRPCSLEVSRLFRPLREYRGFFVSALPWGAFGFLRRRSVSIP
jgi:hypothetical protein